MLFSGLSLVVSVSFCLLRTASRVVVVLLVNVVVPLILP